MAFRITTAAKLLHRPLLITPDAAEYWAARLMEMDHAAFRRPSRFAALTRAIGLGRDKARAWDDDDGDDDAPPRTTPNAYAPMWMGEPDKQLDWGWSVKDGVAMMAIEGPLVEHGGWGLCDFMHGYDTISAAIDELDADASAKGGIIRVDTPGGPVASGIYELAAKINARGPDAKPIWAVCEMACSAGYWIASQFSRVLAPQAGLVGSIGVVMVHVNQAGALEKAGIEVTSIEAPEDGFKTDGASWKALSEEGRAALQSDINELMTAFANTVEAGRGAKLTADKAIALRAQVFPAIHSDKSRDALALGLIDGVMSEQQAFEAMKAELSATANTIPAPAGSAAASAAQTKESDMALFAAVRSALAKRDAKVKAAKGKPDAKTDSETLEEIRQLLNASGEEEEDADAEDTDEEVDAEDDEDEVEAADGEEDDDEDAPTANAPAPKPKATAATVDATVAQAILALPEAKGREALAQRLAFKPGMTLEEAKADLAAAPRKSNLRDNASRVDVSAHASEDTRSEGRKIADRALAYAGIKKPN